MSENIDQSNTNNFTSLPDGVHMPITYEGIVAKSNALDTRVKFFAQITNMK